MRTGPYRNRITFERQSTTQDAAGQQVLTWTAIGHDTARIEPISGREYFARSGEVADVTTRITTRWHPSLDDIRTDDRIVSGDKRYDIISALNPGSVNAEVVFMCATFRP